jgi:hypothetical protein
MQTMVIKIEKFNGRSDNEKKLTFNTRHDYREIVKRGDII